MENSITNGSTSVWFDLILNDHFSADVNLHYFNYKPYIVNFFFGIFCILKPYHALRPRSLHHKFYVPDEEDVIRWALVFNRSNILDLHFVNFYLNDTWVRYEAPLSKQEYNALTNESILSTGKLGNISFHEYSIYPLLNTTDTLTLVIKRLQPRRWSLDDQDRRANGYRYMSLSEPLHTAAEDFWESPNHGKSKLLFQAVQTVLRPLNQSLYNGMSTKAVSGFVHGILYAAKTSEDRLTIRHHQKNGANSFYVTMNKQNSFTLAFLSNFPSTNRIRAISNYNANCEAYGVVRVFGYNYELQTSDVCSLDRSSRFYKNGEDYLENLFQFLKTVINNNLSRKEIVDFVDYFSNVLEQVRPTNIKYDETSNNYLRFFLMGTIISRKENDYTAMVHIFENVFIFKPKSVEYPFIILTLNTDCQRIKLNDIEDYPSNISRSIFCVSINESFRSNDAPLSKKFLYREVSISSIAQHQLAGERKLIPKWVELKRSKFLTDLLEYKLDLNNFAILIEDVFEILYDVDYRYSFHPFMHGLFYRSALSKFVRKGELWFVKSLSRWTYTLQIFDETNGWRNLYFYFLPTFEEVTQFVNSVEQGDSKGTNLFHIFLLYNQKNQKLQTLISQESDVRSAIKHLEHSVCQSYSYYGKYFCGLFREEKGGAFIYHLILIRKYFSMPSPLVIHALVLDEDAGYVKEHYAKKEEISNLVSTWSMARSKKIRPIKKIHDQYLLGENLRKLSIDMEEVYLSKMDIMNIANTAAGRLKGLTKFTATGPIRLAKLINVVQAHSSYLKDDKKYALDAALNALTSKLNSSDPKNILQPLNEVLELVIWEQTIERLSINVPTEFNRSTNEAGLHDIVSTSKMIWNFLHWFQNISSNVCAEGRDCGWNVIELSRPFLTIKKSSNFIQDKPEKKHFYCEKPDLVAIEGEIISNKSLLYHCESFFVLYNSTESEYHVTCNNCTIRVYNVGPGVAVRNALSNNPTYFTILRGLSTIEGGDADNIFDFVLSLQCGSIFGGPGYDTVKLNRHISDDYELLISSYSIGYRLINSTQEETDCILLDSIERIIGQPDRTETVFVDCALTMISLNGGQPNHPDVIHVPQDVNCPDVISLVVTGNTLVRNMAQKGRFLYKVSSLVNSSAKIYLEGIENHVHHTIILEYASVRDITSVSYQNCTISIFSKSGGFLFLSVNGNFDSINLIMRDGEQLVLRGEMLHLELSDVKYGLASLMDKYADLGLLENISLSIESYQFDMNFRILEYTIQHENDAPMPFKFSRVEIDGSDFLIECLSGQTYALIMYKVVGSTSIIKFVRPSISNSVHLIVDLTLLNLGFNGEIHNSTVSITRVKKSTMFLVTVRLRLDKEMDYLLCKLYFAGFGEHELKNVLILHQSKYQPEVQNLKTDSMSSEFTLKESPKLYWHLVDNIARIKPNDVNFNEELTFPTIFYANYDLIKYNNSLIITSICSNIHENVRKFGQNLFTFVLEDFFTNAIMKSLTLKFGDGIVVRTNDLVNSNHLYPAESFYYRLLDIENYLTRRDSNQSIKLGDDLSHEWQEIEFARP